MWTRHKEASSSWEPKMNFLLPPIPTPGFPSLSWQLLGTVPDSVSVCHTNFQVSVRKKAALGVARDLSSLRWNLARFSRYITACLGLATVLFLTLLEGSTQARR